MHILPQIYRLRAKLSSGAKLLKIRNPHAQGEWTGKYSDKDAAWMAEGVTSMKGKRVDRESDDGIFWMCVEDFVANVDDVYFVGTGVENRVDGVEAT